MYFTFQTNFYTQVIDYFSLFRTYSNHRKQKRVIKETRYFLRLNIYIISTCM